jgi:DNA-binding transcriptional LysR family regulator
VYLAHHLCKIAQVNWDDLRYFVALARAGSLSAAARNLKAEHTTVARRVAALEASLRAKLFERAAKGYRLTAQGEEFAALAYRIEGEVLGIERRADASDASVAGVVRVSAPPAIASYYLTEKLALLRQAYPGIIVELMGDRLAANLARREADIAMRLFQPEQGAMVARRVGAFAHGLYGAKPYLAATSDGDRQYLGYDDSLEHVPQQQWVLSLAGPRALVFRSNELACLHQAIVAGVGLGALPRFIGDSDERLQRVPMINEAEATREIWLLVHPDLRGSPRVRVVLEHLAAQVLADRFLLDPS